VRPPPQAGLKQGLFCIRSPPHARPHPLPQPRQGASIGPLVGLALAVNPSVVLLATLATAAVFASFSGAALLTPRRSYLFLGAWLSSAVMGMLAVRLGGWLLGLSKFAFEVRGPLAQVALPRGALPPSFLRRRGRGAAASPARRSGTHPPFPRNPP
jgi:hypothetical protein